VKGRKGKRGKIRSVCRGEILVTGYVLEMVMLFPSSRRGRGAKYEPLTHRAERKEKVEVPRIKKRKEEGKATLPEQEKKRGCILLLP